MITMRIRIIVVIRIVIISRDYSIIQYDSTRFVTTSGWHYFTRYQHVWKTWAIRIVQNSSNHPTIGWLSQTKKGWFCWSSQKPHHLQPWSMPARSSHCAHHLMSPKKWNLHDPPANMTQNCGLVVENYEFSRCLGLQSPTEPFFNLFVV